MLIEWALEALKKPSWNYLTDAFFKKKKKPEFDNMISVNDLPDKERKWMYRI